MILDILHASGTLHLASRTNDSVRKFSVTCRKFIRRAIEDLMRKEPRIVARSVAYIAFSQMGRRFFAVNLPWGKIIVPGNPKKLGIGGLLFSERETFEQNLKPHFAACDGTFVDIGANLGYWSIFVAEQMAKRKIPSSVLAFEPNPSTYALLQKNISLFPDSSIRTEQLALGGSSGFVSMTASNDDPGSTFIDQNSAGSIRQMPLDEYPGLQNTGRISLIKMDVEGYECEVLFGARKTIAKDRPTVICEIIASHLARNHRTPTDIFEFFASIGYTGRLAAEDGLYADPGFVRNGDYVFSPG